MTITVEALVKNGQLKCKKPILLAEGTPVSVTIEPVDETDDPLAGVIGIGASGRTDGAANHDKYIYGGASGKPQTPPAKRRKKQSAKPRRGRQP